MVPSGFIFLTVIMALSIALMIRLSNASEESKGRATKTYGLWLVTWIIYLWVISGTGILANFDLPPRMPLFIVFPALLSAFLFLNKKSVREVVFQLSPVYAIYIQSFRVVVELLIFGAFIDQILPQAVTFEGTNFDILVGGSALIIGLLYQKKIITKKVVLAWNFISLSILGLTVFTFISYFYFSGNQLPDSFRQFVQLPYLLLPGFLLPCAIFYHLVSIKQTKS